MHKIEETIGYEFTNTNLMEEAILAAGASVSDPAIRGDPKGNKRLALVGDAVIQLVILDKWYWGGSDTATGSNTPQKTAANDALSQQASKVHLCDMIKKNPCQEGDAPRETLASTVEALIGAVWFDCGGRINVIEQVMEKLGLFDNH
ncbi:ribonuclease III domain-containing protein [Macrophomina phaseolina]|uniref:Ribonuclease III domain-containing protein n=1 Tax=Macrophomina phaseolina TaxID=35725 RepID=A0ABQ8FWM1_9PEZI|nr:ribonuclease III domain-containing protein [Macrophomina phaseolina]